MAEAVKVKGLREYQRALNAVDKTVARDTKKELKELAEPVAASARARLSRYEGASVNTIRPRASVRGAFVTQGAKKVSGLRGDFGALQMRTVLIPALEEHEDSIVSGVERWLDHVSGSEGF